MILILMVLGARAVISFCILSAIPGYMVELALLDHVRRHLQDWGFSKEKQDDLWVSKLHPHHLVLLVGAPPRPSDGHLRPTPWEAQGHRLHRALCQAWK